MGRRAEISLAVSCALILAGIALVPAAGATSHGAAPSASAQSCGHVAARAAVVSFIAAFNSGKYERLDALFASSPAFQWYSQNDPGRRLGAKAKDRASLVSYFRARHTAGDRLSLVAFQANTGSKTRRNFGLVLRRSVPGFQHGAWFRLDAKGAVECSTSGVDFIVMSLGGPRGEGPTGRARS